MQTYEESWNEIINEGFRDNPFFKDVLREMTKKIVGYRWRNVEKLLIEKGVFNEYDFNMDLIVIEETDPKTQETWKVVDNRARLARALKHLGLPLTEKAISDGLGDRGHEIVVPDVMKKMLPTQDDKEYASFDNSKLTDTPDKYSFVSTDANIAGVQDGRITVRNDGTCIILKQRDSTDRQYYKVRVKDKLIYDDSKSVVALDDGVFIAGGVKFKMVCVEGGTFTMGEDSDAHQVTLSSYYIGETQVTQALWKAVMGTNPSLFKEEGNDRPVERVSWNDCQDFIKELNAKTDKNFRLPTEAEWEYAARGGNQSEGHQYSGSDNLNEVAWYGGTEGTHPVGKKGANELDIYDMSGNVWEWCQDWYGENYYKESPQTNPTGPASGEHRVHRGGGWNSYAENCPLSFRRHDASDYAHLNLGFRLALSE